MCKVFFFCMQATNHFPERQYKLNKPAADNKN